MRETARRFDFTQEISGDFLDGRADGGRRVRFSVGTLVTRRDEYEAALESFLQAGFGTDDCEYLYINNAGGTQVSAYEGLNRLLNAARGEFVILCHQDIRLCFDDRDVLERRLAELSAMDARWGLAGNAGVVALNILAMRISDIYGENQSIGPFPRKVMSLDENFIIVRRHARLGFSNDLSGFHFYGTDICLNAEIMGFNAYVIDFHLRHLGLGRMDADFYSAQRAFEEKWNRVLRPRLMQTTCAQMSLGRLCGLDRRIIAYRLRNVLKRFEKKVNRAVKGLLR